MPNWCMNDLIIRGNKKDLDKLEATEFDFQKIIPSPQELLDDCNDENIGGKITTKKLIDTVFPKEHDESIWAFDRLTPKEAQTAKRWIKEYGFPGWYYWRNAHWGTKWNASEIKIDRHSDKILKVFFDTAWGPPIPIFHYIVKHFNVVIDGRCDIEGNESYIIHVDEGGMTETELGYEENPIGDVLCLDAPAKPEEDGQ